jgi:hypothetical protein
VPSDWSPMTVRLEIFGAQFQCCCTGKDRLPGIARPLLPRHRISGDQLTHATKTASLCLSRSIAGQTYAASRSNIGYAHVPHGHCACSARWGANNTSVLSNGNHFRNASCSYWRYVHMRWATRHDCNGIKHRPDRRQPRRSDRGHDRAWRRDRFWRSPCHYRRLKDIAQTTSE